MNKNFIKGFEKVALALNDDHLTNSLEDGALAILFAPATTLGPLLGKRPEGHSRILELFGRAGGAVAGGSAGAGLAHLMGANIGLGSAAGIFGGAALGSHISTRGSYGKDGKLKPSAKKSMK